MTPEEKSQKKKVFPASMLQKTEDSLKGKAKITKQVSIRCHCLCSYFPIYCHSQASHTSVLTVLQTMTFNLNMKSSIQDESLFLVPTYSCSVQMALRKHLHLPLVNKLTFMRQTSTNSEQQHHHSIQFRVKMS